MKNRPASRVRQHDSGGALSENLKPNFTPVPSKKEKRTAFSAPDPRVKPFLSWYAKEYRTADWIRQQARRIAG